MTFHEWECYIEGYISRQEDEWRHTREIIAAIYNSAYGQEKTYRGSDIIPLKDDKVESIAMTYEKMDALRKKYNFNTPDSLYVK